MDKSHCSCVRKRQRTKTSDETKDEKINELLDEIGVIRSAEKRASVIKPAIIDLLSPESAGKDASRQSHKAKHFSTLLSSMDFESPSKATNLGSTIDLTTPENKACDRKSSKRFSPGSPELELLSRVVATGRKGCGEQFDELTEKLECRNKDGKNIMEIKVSSPRARRKCCVMTRYIKKSTPWVAMEQSLSQSCVGEAIKSLLSSMTTTARSTPFQLLPSFACTVPNVLIWSRPSMSVQVLCIYTSAYEFLQLLSDKGYNGLSQYLQAAIKECWGSKDTGCVATSSRVFWIVEKLDEALLHHNKACETSKRSELTRSRHERKSQIASQDIFEITFQLFEDFRVHIKQTCDEEDSIAYIELITREVGKPCRKMFEHDLQELLEAVPRLNAIRVLSDGNTANMFANAWLRMLLLIPGVSEEKAQSILDHYPTFTSLYGAYRNPSQSREEKQNLLAYNVSGGKIERALSVKIFDIFGSVDSK